MKQNVSLFLLLICLLVPCKALSNPSTSISFGDSLRQVVSQSEEPNKFREWQRIVTYYNVNSQLDKMRLTIDAMSEYAEKSDNPRMIALPKIQLLIYYYNKHDRDSLEMFAPAYLECFKEQNLLYQYFQTYEFRILLAQNNPEYENDKVELVMEMYEKAREFNYPEGIALALKHLGNYYISIGRYDDAENSFCEALDILESSKQPGACNEVYMLYVNMLQNESRYDDVLALLKKQEPYIKKTDSICLALGAPGATTMYRFYMDRGYFYAYIGMKDKEMARHYLQVMKESPLAKGGVYTPMELQHATIDLYILEEKYNEALTLSDSLLFIAKQMNEWGAIKDQLNRQRKLYLLMGDAVKLNEIVNQQQAHNDSITSLEQNAKIDELRTIYEVDKIKFEKEKQRIYTLAATVGCALLFIILILSVVYTRRLKQKNWILYQQIQGRLHAEEDVEKSILTPANAETPSRETELFRNITEVMQKKRLFAQPDIDRKGLAEAMGTNEKYVADAIRQATGETVLGYITRLRMQHALLLLEKQPELSLEAVAEESGHSSYSSFYRTFTKAYGMNPSEYKKLASKRL